MTEEAEIIELFGVKFTGRLDPKTGRIYVPYSKEMRPALAELGRIGREMRAKEGEGE